MKTLDEIAWEVAKEMPEGFLWWEGCGHEAGILKEEVIDFTKALLERLTRDAEPVAWMYQDDDDFDGVMWRSNYRTTTDETVARFRGKGDVKPLFTLPLTQPNSLTTNLRPTNGPKDISDIGCDREEQTPPLTQQVPEARVPYDMLTEVHLVSNTYDKIRSERPFAIDDLEYDLFAAGWKACARIAAALKEESK